MRRYVFFSAVLLCGLLSAGCGKEMYAVSIINNASRAVAYSYNGESNKLEVSATKKYTVKAYTQPPRDIADENGILSITMINRQGETYTFTDAASMNINAVNTLPVTVTIKAGYYMDNAGSIELTIPAGETKTAVIYTEKPEFTAVSDYPAVVDWNITKPENIENKIMYITIR